MDTAANTGRPTSFTQDKADTVCELIAQGMSGRVASEKIGIAESTLYLWLKDQPGFSEQYARARERQADKLAHEVIEIADEIVIEASYKGDEVTLDVSSSAVARNRLRVDARKWAAGKLAPKKYGDKLELEHKGEMKVTLLATDADL